MISAQQLSISRGGRIVLSGVDLVAGPGEVVGVVGPNGSGKTSLLLALSRALRASQGSVVVDEHDIKDLSRREIAQRIAVVAQDNDTVLPLTVRDAVNLGRLSSRSLFTYGDSSDRRLVAEALRRVQATHLADRLITELSGGERQRVLVARAIAQQATHLLLDEPTNHLDLRHQFALLSLVTELGCTVVMVLHDLNLAARYCERVLLIDEGRPVASGPPEEVLVPDVLEPVYHLLVFRHQHEGRPHLIFTPRIEQEIPT